MYPVISIFVFTLYTGNHDLLTDIYSEQGRSAATIGLSQDTLFSKVLCLPSCSSPLSLLSPESLRPVVCNYVVKETRTTSIIQEPGDYMTFKWTDDVKIRRC